MDFGGILQLFLTIISFVASSYFMFRRGMLFYSFLFYYQMIINGCVISISVTWYSCSDSIASFYVSIVLLFVFYIVFCAYTIGLHKKSFFLSNKKIFIYISKFIVIITSLVFVFWIIVLLGIIVHDNELIEIENIYDLIPDNFSLSTLFNCIKGLFNATIRFFEVGICQMFVTNNDEIWMAFLQSVRWSYGSIIVITVVNIIINMLGINNMNFDIKTKDFKKIEKKDENDIDE